MAYVPPHRRIATPGHPSSEAPPSSSRIQQWPGDRGKQHRLTPSQPDIHWASGGIRRFLVIPDPGSSNNLDVLLQFSRFHGQSFAHLQHNALFTLNVLPSPSSADRSLCQKLETLEIDRGRENEKLSQAIPQSAVLKTWQKLETLEMDRGLKEEELSQVIPQFPAFASLREDLCRALAQVKDFVAANATKRIVPSMILRFGSVLFSCDSAHSSSGSLDWHKALTPRMLEKAWEEKSLGRDVRKTFDTCVTYDLFTHLENIALEEARESIVKERYLVKVEDKERPTMALLCNCYVKTDGGSSNSGLILKKVRFVHSRYMVADMAFIGKKSHLRLIVAVAEHLQDLPREEKQELQKIISNASINPNVKGGLHWSLSTNKQTSRFKVVGAWHMKKRLHKGESMRWKFIEANRTEFQASSGRLSYEVEVTSDLWKKYLMGERDYDQARIISLVEGTMEWIWKKCL